MILLLQRNRCDAICTRGTLSVATLILQALELPYDANRPDVSCVPIGDYDLIPYDSATHGLVWRLHAPYLNVYGTGLVPEGARFGVEIHSGNWVDTQSLGCIFVGVSAGELLNPASGKVEPAVLDSDIAMVNLRAVLGPVAEHTLIIQSD